MSDYQYRVSKDDQHYGLWIAAVMLEANERRIRLVGELDEDNSRIFVFDSEISQEAIVQRAMVLMTESLKQTV